MKSRFNIVTRHVQSGFFGRLSFSFRPVFIYFEFLSFLWVNNVFIKSSFHSKQLTYHWHILSFFWCFKEKMNKCKNTEFSMSPQRSMGQKIRISCKYERTRHKALWKSVVSTVPNWYLKEKVVGSISVEDSDYSSTNPREKLNTVFLIKWPNSTCTIL